MPRERRKAMAEESMTVREARAQLSQLMGRVAASRDVIAISRWGVERRALLVGADTYDTLQEEAEELRELSRRLDDTLRGTLEAVAEMEIAIGAQVAEVDTLRKIAEDLQAQIEEEDPIQARSARQQVQRSSRRAEELSRAIQQGADKIREQVRDLQRWLEFRKQAR
jgi:prevent-host-death family protein